MCINFILKISIQPWYFKWVTLRLLCLLSCQSQKGQRRATWLVARVSRHCRLSPLPGVIGKWTEVVNTVLIPHTPDCYTHEGACRPVSSTMVLRLDYSTAFSFEQFGALWHSQLTESITHYHEVAAVPAYLVSLSCKHLQGFMTLTSYPESSRNTSKFLSKSLPCLLLQKGSRR